MLNTKTLTWDDVYPVGSIYMSVNAINPGDLFGGEWEQIQNRFLLAAGTSYNNGTTGGSATHTPSGTLSGGAVGNHTLTEAEMPSHTHKGLYWSIPDSPGYVVTLNTGTYGYHLNWNGVGGSTTGGGGRNENTMRVGVSGSSAAHNHPFTQPIFTGTAQDTMPPYLAVYMWKRVS